VHEAQELDRAGVKELNLIAQDTTRYGLDIYGEYKLAALVKEITKSTSIPWIRLLYCYPDKITDELIEEFNTNPRLVNYMDIPVQHIADSVLTRMNRHGGKSLIVDTIRKLRDKVPGITLRTTAMVGFPGETEEDFTELCEFIKETRFDRFGAFTFSPEEDTEAALMPDQIDEQVKLDRLDIIMRDQLEINTQLNEEKIGKTLTVIYEGFDEISQTHFGRSAADAPEIDGKIYFKLRKRVPLETGDFVKVKVTDVFDYDLMGVLVS
jgi:ribosomal protein S12 methylthiotransferase